MSTRLPIFLFALFLFACNEKKPRKESIVTKEDELKRSIQQFPDSLLLVENLVQYYRDNGDYKKALKVTDEAIKRDSMEAVYLDMKATLLFEDGDTIAAIDAYNKLIRLEASPEYIIALGSVYAQTRNPKALEIADHLLAEYKIAAEKEALFIKGMYYNFSGDKKQAIAYFDECIDLDYTYVLAYREKAIALYDLELYYEAIKVLEKAVTVRNNYEEAYYWLGRCYEKTKQVKEAIEAYHMAILYDKNYQEAQDAIKRLEK